MLAAIASKQSSSSFRFVQGTEKRVRKPIQPTKVFQFSLRENMLREAASILWGLSTVNTHIMKTNKQKSPTPMA
jgi:hypothetical protein